LLPNACNALRYRQPFEDAERVWSIGQRKGTRRCKNGKRQLAMNQQAFQLIAKRPIRTTLMHSFDTALRFSQVETRRVTSSPEEGWSLSTWDTSGVRRTTLCACQWENRCPVLLGTNIPHQGKVQQSLSWCLVTHRHIHVAQHLLMKSESIHPSRSCIDDIQFV
jgi:hypothetical protein